MGAIAPDSFKVVPKEDRSDEQFRTHRQSVRYMTHLWYRTDPGGDGLCIDLDEVASVARLGQPRDFWRGIAAHLALDAFWSRIVWKDYGLSALPEFYAHMRRLDAQMVRLYPRATTDALVALEREVPIVTGRSDLCEVFQPHVLKSWNEWCIRDIRTAQQSEVETIVPTMSPSSLRKAWAQALQWMMKEGLFD